MRFTRSRALAAAALCFALTAPLAGCTSEPGKKVASTCPPSNPKPSRQIAWSSIYANVYNAGGGDGQGKRVAQQLKWRGLNILDVSNDPKSGDRPAPKYAEIRYGKMGRTIALNLAQQIPHANLFLDTDRSDATVDIVLGDKFKLTPLPPRPIKDVDVTVINTSFYGGLANEVNNELLKQGFTSKTEPNDRAYYPNDTAVVVYDEEGLPDAQRVALSLKDARLLVDTQAHVDMSGRAVRVYLGSKWSERGSVIPLAQATPKPTPSSGTCS